MSPEQMLVFCGASLALIFAPGPDIIYVMTRGAAQGRGAALAAAAGFSLGNIVHVTAAILGVSALVASSATAFAVVKYAGAAYLLYLGLCMFRAPAPDQGAQDGADAGKPARAVFRQSVLANILNPKVAIFFLAFFPQFIRQGGAHPAVQMAVLGATFIVLTWICFSLVGLTAGVLAARLRRRPGAGRTLNRVGGSVLMALGLSLAFAKR
ncbi:LysE family translocator [Desulfocurvus sp. DL9XJH121]